VPLFPSGHHKTLFDCFPRDDQRGIRGRRKQVLKKLLDDGLMRGIPDFGRDASWQGFFELVK
jgi:hypothetical protein